MLLNVNSKITLKYSISRVRIAKVTLETSLEKYWFGLFWQYMLQMQRNLSCFKDDT